MTAKNTYDLHGALGYQLTITARTIEKRFDDRLKTLSLTRVFWCILLAVEAEQLHLPSEIADYIGLDRTAVSRALRQMEQVNLVQRHAGKHDRRTTKVTLTGHGADLLQQAIPFARENAGAFAQKLSPTEHATLELLLRKLRTGETQKLQKL